MMDTNSRKTMARTGRDSNDLRRREDEQKLEEHRRGVLDFHRKEAISHQRKKQDEKAIKKEEETSLVGHLVKAGLSSTVTNAMLTVFSEAAVAPSMATPATPERLTSVEGRIIKGPAAGGGFLNRPIAGALAEQSASRSLSVAYGSATPGVARAAGSGVMAIDGLSIPVSEYLPGSNLAKIATGQTMGASDGISMMAERGIEEGRQGKTSPGPTKAPSSKAQAGRQAFSPVAESGDSYGRSRAASAAAASSAVQDDHRAALAEALRSTDANTVVTEREGVCIETSFEARNPDNALEVREGMAHVTDAIRNGGATSNHDAMKFQTFMKEMAESSDRDIGLVPHS